MESELLQIHPQTKWTLTNIKLNVIIHANSIFDISSCCVYRQLDSIKFPSTFHSKTEKEYLELMEKEGFKIDYSVEPTDTRKF